MQSERETFGFVKKEKGLQHRQMMTTFFKNLYFLRYSHPKLVFIVLILLLSLLVVVFVLKGNLKLFLRQWDPKVHSPLDHMSDKEDKPGEKIRKVELLTSHRAVEPSSSELSIRPKNVQILFSHEANL